MNPVTPNNDLIKEVVSLFINAIPNSIIWAFQLIWNILKTFLHNNLVAVTAILLIILVYAILRALMGDWWILGRVLHKYLYWGSGLLIAFIWGPEVFAGTYVEIWLYILSIVCFVVVGMILNKFNFRNRRY